MSNRKNINRKPPTSGEMRGGPSGGNKPIYGCTDPNATNFNSVANINDGSCIYEEPISWDGWQGPQQSNVQYFIGLCANRNDCYAGCGNEPNEDFSNWCGQNIFGQLWYNGDEPDYPYGAGEGCCVNDSPPIYSDYWSQNNDMNFPTIDNAFGDNISWEPYDSIFVMNCGRNSDECPEDIFTQEFYSRICTHLWIPSTGYQDIQSALSHPEGHDLFVDGDIYNPGVGFWANVNMQSYGNNQEAFENYCAVSNPIHIFVYKRSRGQLFRTDIHNSLIIPKGSFEGNWLDWPEEYVYLANEISFTKILPLGYYQTVGCMDPTAYNYNPMANLQEPGSCNYTHPKWGCTNPSCENYDVDANTDDGSCTGCPEECRWPCPSGRDEECGQYENFGSADTGRMFCLDYCCMERSPAPSPPTPQGRGGGNKNGIRRKKAKNAMNNPHQGFTYTSDSSDYKSAQLVNTIPGGSDLPKGELPPELKNYDWAIITNGLAGPTKDTYKKFSNVRLIIPNNVIVPSRAVITRRITDKFNMSISLKNYILSEGYDVYSKLILNTETIQNIENVWNNNNDIRSIVEELKKVIDYDPNTPIYKWAQPKVIHADLVLIIVVCCVLFN